MADIFLSYAEEDRETAGAIARLLESMGWSVWWDRKIPTGQTWREVIESALREMRCMVVLWSKNSIASHWVNEEAEEARTLKKLWPVLIDGVDPPIGFRYIQAVDMSAWDGSIEAPSARQLIDDLASFLNAAKVDPAATTSPEQGRPGVGAIADGLGGAMVQKAHDADSERKSALRFNRGMAPWLIAPAGILALLLGIFVWKNYPTAPDSPVKVIDSAKQSPNSKKEKPNELVSDPVSAPMAARHTAVEPSPVAADPVTRKPAVRLRPARPTRCTNILQRAQLGEPVSAEDQAFLQKECQR